jgi:hypothetical protein
MAYIDLETNSAGLPGGTAGPNPYTRTPAPRRPPNPSRRYSSMYDGGDDGSDPGTGAPPAPTPAKPPAPPPATPGSGSEPPPTPNKFSHLDQNKILTLLRTFGNATTDHLRAAFPQLLSEGLIPEGSYLENKPTADEIFLPGYGWLDLITGADNGGGGDWSYSMGEDTGSFFNDPIGAWFSKLVGSVIDQLGQPREMAGQVNDSYNILRQLATSGGSAPDLTELQNLTKQRVGELNAEPFSATEEAAQRVKAFDNLERSRAAAIQQVRERLTAQGHAPSSGTVESAIQQVNQSFDGLRAQNENGLLLNNVNERQRRKSEAVSLEQQLADRQLSAGSLTEQGRSRSVGAAGSLSALAQYIANFNDPMSRLAMILQAAGMIPNLESQRFRDAQSQASGD